MVPLVGEVEEVTRVAVESPDAIAVDGEVIATAVGARVGVGIKFAASANPKQVNTTPPTATPTTLCHLKGGGGKTVTEECNAFLKFAIV